MTDFVTAADTTLNWNTDPVSTWNIVPKGDT